MHEYLRLTIIHQRGICAHNWPSITDAIVVIRVIHHRIQLYLIEVYTLADKLHPIHTWHGYLGQSCNWRAHSFSMKITRFLSYWRHNERDSVSNHRRVDCLLNRLSRRRSKKISKLRVTAWPLWGEFTGDRWITGTKGQDISNQHDITRWSVWNKLPQGMSQRCGSATLSPLHRSPMDSRHKRPVVRGFGDSVVADIHHKLLSKQPSYRWFEISYLSYDVVVIAITFIASIVSIQCLVKHIEVSPLG